MLELYTRDLLRLRDELNLYTHEAAIWEIRPGIANSAGTLCLHLVGNLRHFIGAVLGNTGYIRQRELEFSLRNVPRAELLKSVEETILDVENTIRALELADFDKIYPLEKNGQIVTTHHMLLHLFGHLGYHLGQINYHRRLTA
jgi:uncharacterized damage-inducible protein DinB